MKLDTRFTHGDEVRYNGRPAVVVAVLRGEPARYHLTFTDGNAPDVAMNLLGRVIQDPR